MRSLFARGNANVKIIYSKVRLFNPDFGPVLVPYFSLLKLDIILKVYLLWLDLDYRISVLVYSVLYQKFKLYLFYNILSI